MRGRRRKNNNVDGFLFARLKNSRAIYSRYGDFQTIFLSLSFSAPSLCLCLSLSLSFFGIYLVYPHPIHPSFAHKSAITMWELRREGRGENNLKSTPGDIGGEGKITSNLPGKFSLSLLFTLSPFVFSFRFVSECFDIIHPVSFSQCYNPVVRCGVAPL